jgi:hypothetical protein
LAFTELRRGRAAKGPSLVSARSFHTLFYGKELLGERPCNAIYKNTTSFNMGLGAKKIFIYRDVKITFKDGKVADAE